MNTVILKQLAVKYNITAGYVRICVKEHSNSDIAPLIQKDYKQAVRKFNDLLETLKQ